MAKSVFVKLTKDQDWIETEVPNFYDPERHHTVRLQGEAKKRSYAIIKMPDGRCYDKIENKWFEEAQPLPDKLYKLHLGCGNDKLVGYVNIDCSEVVEPDLLLNLEEDTLPFPDNSVDEIYANHVLEHIHNLIPLMNECQRVLTKNGLFRIIVPNVIFPQAFQDPTHVRFFTQETFKYWHEGNPLYENYGKSYGIRGFRKFVQKCEGISIKTQLWK